MLEPQFERLRSEVGDAVRQPDFLAVRRRARQVRRRRTLTAGMASLATVLTAAGLGHLVPSGPADRHPAGPAPAISGEPSNAWPRLASATTAGKELYSVLAPCGDCDSELYASSDGGSSWQARTVPPVSGDIDLPRTVTLIPLATKVIAWSERGTVHFGEAVESSVPAPGKTPRTEVAPPTRFHRLWITTDGGRTWRRAAVDTPPLASVPEESKPVDCQLLRITTCAVAAVDPVTGRFAPLVSQPDDITVLPGWTSRINVSPSESLWVPGLDPATNKPAVASSSDGGRTWHTHVFHDAVAPRADHRTEAVPHVAAGSTDTAYVLTYGAENLMQAHYTVDGGLTWQAGDSTRVARYSGDFVARDGSHILLTGIGAVTARGTGRYAPVTLSGYPENPTGTTQVASQQSVERYLVTSATQPYLSQDGLSWRPVRHP